VFWAKIFEQVHKVQAKSITDSLFRYGFLLFILGTSASIFSEVTWVMIFLFCLGSVFVICGLVFYCYFSFKNPDYLRSEGFQIKKQSIEMLGDKENQLNPNIKNIVYISSPYQSLKGIEGQTKQDKKDEL
jgi:hypothetical protein